MNWTAIDLAENLSQVTGLAVTEEHVYQVERGRYRCKPAVAAAWAEAIGLPPAVAFPEVFPAAVEVRE